MNILNLGFWKKLVYILEKKLSLQLCLKFFAFRNYLLLTKAFLTQEEKLEHKTLLETWNLKAQVKGFIAEKQRVITRQVRKGQLYTLFEEF